MTLAITNNDRTAVRCFVQIHLWGLCGAESVTCVAGRTGTGRPVSPWPGRTTTPGMRMETARGCGSPSHTTPSDGVASQKDLNTVEHCQM
ncbi:hypothetical protein JTE90_017347 [Oedothorax gibbosus]|uniref:Uncharacterized protein n=1 Tax=Oedothorax gibbosus TaxID=931172 RepID=A0AAV6VPC7_9ARAC|nr:hypothetical protein JTE90_017347 [Oedothorax gibbosus]